MLWTQMLMSERLTYIYTFLVFHSVRMTSCRVSVEISQTVPLPWACVMRLPSQEGRVWTLVCWPLLLLACSRPRDCNSTTTSTPFGDKILPCSSVPQTYSPILFSLGHPWLPSCRLAWATWDPKKKSESHPLIHVKKSSFIIYSFFFIQMRSY